jgi:hypothetical protein
MDKERKVIGKRSFESSQLISPTPSLVSHKSNTWFILSGWRKFKDAITIFISFILAINCPNFFWPSILLCKIKIRICIHDFVVILTLLLSVINNDLSKIGFIHQDNCFYPVQYILILYHSYLKNYQPIYLAVTA